MDKINDGDAAIYKRWTNDPEELREALLNPGAIEDPAEREAAARLRAAVLKASPFAQAAEEFGQPGLS